MPIKITDFEWKQNDSLAFIKFGLKNINPKNVDILYTASYLKVNFCPYIFEVFLRHKIDPEKSSAIIKEGNLHFLLSKAESETWESLEENPKGKDDAQKMREEALKEYQLNQNKKDKERKENRSSLERMAISKQISLNDEKHSAEKEFLKQEELNFFKENHSAADSPSKENRMRLSSLCSEDGSTVASEGDYDGDEESVNYSSTENLTGMIKSRRLIIDAKEKKGRKESYPSIRQSRCIKICHSSYKASVPKRELLSSSQDEEILETNDAETSIDKTVDKEKEELKSDAKKCFESGDYEKSVKIYTILLDRYPAQASFYSNRAAAYLATNSHKEAVADCTKALELLFPLTKENAKSRLLCHVRRGTSNIRLRDLNSALMDFESALRLDPSNVDLAKDVTNIKKCLKSCATTDTDDNSSECESSSEEESGSISEDLENKKNFQSENST